MTSMRVTLSVVEGHPARYPSSALRVTRQFADLSILKTSLAALCILCISQCADRRNTCRVSAQRTDNKVSAPQQYCPNGLNPFKTRNIDKVAEGNYRIPVIGLFLFVKNH
jgi:hypothetical protein